VVHLDLVPAPLYPVRIRRGQEFDHDGLTGSVTAGHDRLVGVMQKLIHHDPGRGRVAGNKFRRVSVRVTNDLHWPTAQAAFFWAASSRLSESTVAATPDMLPPAAPLSYAPAVLGLSQDQASRPAGPVTEMEERIVLIRHATASAFVFARLPDAWRLGLVAHPRLDRLMIPGGHVEADESQDQAALREVAEETGLTARLVELRRPHPPAGYPYRTVVSPWWITEMPATPDNHLATEHIHVDHQYVAIADNPTPAVAGAHPFGWHTAAQLPDLGLFPDTHLLATTLFACIEQAASGDADAVLAAFGVTA
jgi:8-oxo-dGTP pyrophosphatase MutT (NUDIX family)